MILLELLLCFPNDHHNIFFFGPTSQLKRWQDVLCDLQGWDCLLSVE